MFSFFKTKEVQKKDSEYLIKFFPIKGMYVVMYKGNYLETNQSSGFIREGRLPEVGGEHMAEQFYSEKEARKYIQQHKEQTCEYIIIKP